MGEDLPDRDVEQQHGGPTSPTAAEANGVKQGAAKTEEKESALKRFFNGPYFDIIPAQFERSVRARNSAGGLGGTPTTEADPNALDYLGRLKTVVMNPIDTDGVYGLEPHELVPLPFDAPLWHMYLVDILAGVYLVAQATVVMFIAICKFGVGALVENQERAWKSGDSYTRSWLPLVKALVIIYPLITLLVLVSFTVEYAIRKFMYFRLLSMRILVDWENTFPWKTSFFYYFVGTWVIMNAWAIYGLVKYYNQNGYSGVDPTSFGTFVVLNLQTVQLFIQYFKLLSSEARLVSLNQIFERAPIEAQHLLELTYVIEEQDLIDECYKFARDTQRILKRRMLNIMTCGLAGRDWITSERSMSIDIERLKRRAPNYQEVEARVERLRQEWLSQPAESRRGAGTFRGVRPDSAKSTVDVQLEVDDAGVMSRDAQVDVASADKPRPERCCCCGWQPLKHLYQNAYASFHAFHASVMYSYHTWPFRRDIPYFRMFSLIQLFGIFAVGAIVVLGWVFSTRETSCTKSAKTCTTCLAVHQRYFTSSHPTCPLMEKAIANIVASANGTWNNNGVVEERYCNWACYGNFTVNGSCPALSL